MTQYAQGRLYEYAVRDQWVKKGYIVLRSAGSKGPFDLVALWPGPDANRRPCAIQCKRVSSLAEAKRIKKAFLAAPPLGPNNVVLQWIYVIVKHTKEEVIGWT